jgi:hypothetical protein
VKLVSIVACGKPDSKQILLRLGTAAHNSLAQYVEPFEHLFPDHRLWANFCDLISGLLSAQSTRVARINAHLPQVTKKPFYQAKRFYRFLQNPRLLASRFLKPLYRATAEMIQATSSRYILVALDFSNIEKPYAYHLEGLSLVKRSSNSKGPRRKKKDTVAGYNFLTALAFTPQSVALCYAKLISYRIASFVSINRYTLRAIRYACLLAAGRTVRFVCDRGFDDEKTFAFICSHAAQFVIRLRRTRNLLLRTAEGLWQYQLPLEEVVERTPGMLRFQTRFRVRGRLRQSTVSLGYREVHLHQYPQRRLWLVVARTSALRQDWFLLTNVPVQSNPQALRIWRNYRQRWGIECWFRFLKEEGLHIEDFRVRHLESISRLVNLTLIAALFTLNRQLYLPAPLIQYLLFLGGKLGLKADKDGPYLFLTGLSRLLQTLALLSTLRHHPPALPP